jgi:hypothetical protein
MAELTVLDSARTGTEIAFAAAAGGGDKFDNNGNVLLHVINGDASPKTVTIISEKTVDGQAVADPAGAVAAGAQAVFGPFPPSIYNDGDGHVNITYSAVTSVTVAAIRKGS